MSVVALEAKATKRPLLEIADSLLSPSAGVVPSGVETRLVAGAHVLPVVPMVVTHVALMKISFTGPGLGAPRLGADDVNETKSPWLAMAGCELGPSAGVVPSSVDTRYVVGVQELLAGGTMLHVSRR
jgi:hypothetical protein